MILFKFLPAILVKRQCTPVEVILSVWYNQVLVVLSQHAYRNFNQMEINFQELAKKETANQYKSRNGNLAYGIKLRVIAPYIF